MPVRILEFLHYNNFFYAKQYGFLAGLSTTHTLIETIDFITKALNNNENVIGLDC